MIHKPTIGRVVYFKTSKDAAHETATICDVHSDTVVSLDVTSRGGTHRFEASVTYQGDAASDRDAASRCWYWPPRS
jgi:hypothetical protein